MIETNKKYTNTKFTATVGPTDEKPYFAVLGEGYKEVSKSGSVSGKLTWIKPTFTPAKGKMGDIYGFKVFLEDGNDVVVIESTITNASKDMLNSLLMCKGKVVRVDAKLNKQKYPTAYVTDVDTKEWVKDGALDFKSLDGKTLHSKISEVFAETKETKAEEISVEDIPF